MLFLAIVFGCIMGFAAGYLVTALWIARSNDIGNSKGSFSDFTRYPLHVIRSENKIKKPPL